MGGFGPPPTTRLVWVVFKQGAAFLDADGERVLQIRDNVVTMNKDNICSVEQLPTREFRAA
jgi:hypothetical protein